MEKVKAVWYEIVESLWFLPAVLTLMGGALATLLVQFNDRLLSQVNGEDVWWLFGGTAEGAKSVLESISGSIITVTGVVFSVTIVALQLASGQFTPRVLRQFMADRANQLVLGVFIGTFTYALLVQRTVRSGEPGEEFVPSFAVTGAVLLALTSIGFLIFFIDHVAHSIQASTIIDSSTMSTLRVLRVVYPDELRDSGEDAEAQSEAAATRGEGEACEIRAARAGYLQALDRGRIRQLATENDLLIRSEIEIGAHVLAGMSVMRVWPAEKVSEDVEQGLRDALVQGRERTPHQDLKHGVTELVDIAVKALSPGVNDPTTAINALHRLGEVLLETAWRKRGDELLTDDAGRVRVVLPRPRMDVLVGLAFDQIRVYGAANPSFAIVMMRLLGELAALSPAPARELFVEQLRAVIRSAQLEVKDVADGERLEQAAGDALSRADAPAPQRPSPRRRSR